MGASGMVAPLSRGFRAGYVRWAPLALIFVFVVSCLASSSPRPRRVAIIGAGIGGAATAHYISEAARAGNVDPFEIHIFEKESRVGGRIRSFSVQDEVPVSKVAEHEASGAKNQHKAANAELLEATGGNVTQQKYWFELGAAVWAAPNLLLDDLARRLSIEVDASDENAASDDLSAVVYEGGKDSTSYELALGDASETQTLRVVAQMEKFKVNLLQNYLEFLPRDYGLEREIEEHKYQPRNARVPIEKIRPWTNISEWAKHGKIDAFTSVSTREYLHAHGVSYNYTMHHIEPLTRVIYDQGAGANAFAGFAALVSADQTRVATHGLQSMVSRIIESSKAKLHLNTPISIITRTAEGHKMGNFEIISGPGGASKYFDIVVLAAPLEFLDIKFTHLPHVQHVERRAYVGKSSTYVRAQSLNWRFFKVPKNTTALLTNARSDDNNVGFFSIWPHHKFYNGEYLFKVFSRLPLSEMPQSLENWFVGGKILDAQDWAYTFPVLDPPTPHILPPHCRSHNSLVDGISEFQPIIIEKDLYYTSAIDSVAVAMEASTLAAHNIAQMIVYGHTHKSLQLDPHEQEGKEKKSESQTSAPQSGCNAFSTSSSSKQRPFKQPEIVMLIKSYLSEERWTLVSEALPWCRIYELASVVINRGDIYLLSWFGLGVVYGVSDLVWIRPRFNAFWLFALLCIAHAIGYWYEVVALAVTSADVTEGVHAHATIVAAEIFAGILVAVGTCLGDAILPMAMLARTVVNFDKWTSAGALAGLAIWPAISQQLFSLLALFSRMYGGPLPSLSLLDVNMSTAVIVSGSLVFFGIVSAQFSNHSTKPILKLAPVLALSHIGFLFAGEFLGNTSLWALLVPSHVASYLHQDGLAAIIDPLSSTQTFILILVPFFLIGSYAGSALTRLFPPSEDAQPHPPRFCGPLRALGAFLLVIGMAFHSGSYQFLASFAISTTLLGLL